MLPAELRPALLAVLLGAPALATQSGSPAQVANLLKLTDGFATQELTFGLDPCATDGLDPCVGEPNLPPLPPLGAFDARFVGWTLGLPMDQGSWVDIRQGDTQTQGTVDHELSLQLGFGTAWTIAYALPNGIECVLEDLFGGVIFQETLLGTGQVQITNPALDRLMLHVSYGPPKPLFSKTHELSLASGGVQVLALDAGAAHGLDLYLVLGTLSGTSPGTPVDGLTLPLNRDLWFMQTLMAPNQAPLAQTLGTLDPAGMATASVSLPPGSNPLFAGLELHHAFATLNPGAAPGAPLVTFTSNALPLGLVP